MKLLLFIGTKRTGSSLMVKLLDKHPKISMRGEMDAIWLAYQISQGKPFGQLKKHPQDGGHGLRGTKGKEREFLKAFIAKNNFDDDAMRGLIFDLLERRRDVKNAIYIGEKKPIQLTTPKVYHFVVRLFPDVKFLHLIRHPKCVCRDNHHAWKTWAKANAFVANQIDLLEQVKEDQQRFYTMRYEDLITDPNLEMADFFKFLNLPKSKINYRQLVKSDRNKKHDKRQVPKDIPLANTMLNRFCYSKETATIADGG